MYSYCDSVLVIVPARTCTYMYSNAHQKLALQVHVVLAHVNKTALVYTCTCVWSTRTCIYTVCFACVYSRGTTRNSLISTCELLVRFFQLTHGHHCTYTCIYTHCAYIAMWHSCDCTYIFFPNRRKKRGLL